MTDRFPGRIRFILPAVLVVCACLILGYGVWRFMAPVYPVLGKEAPAHIEIVENHKSVLAYWAGQGIQDAVLLNLDAHDDIKRVAAEQVLAGGRHYGPDASRDVMARTAEGNFIYAAAKLGIIKEVYWILPAAFLQARDQEKQLAFLLKYYNFLDEDIKGFRFANGCYRGEYDHIPLNICGIESLPDLTEPVVLSIDVDYVPFMADSAGERLIETVQRSFQALFAKGYQVRDAVVSYSVDGGHLRAHHRWVGDLIIDLLKNPGLLAGALPERYHTLQKADLLQMMGRYDEQLKQLFPVLENDLYNPSVLMYMAQALAGNGSMEQSYNCAEKACMIDRNYCYGLCEIGSMELRDHGLAAGERFFTRAYALNPQMSHSQFILAQALRKAGRYDSAIRFFTEFRKHYGPFPVDFYIGETYLLKGEEALALDAFNSGRLELMENPYSWAGFGDAGIVRRTMQFYREKGQDKYADELRDSLRMKDRFFAGGPHSMAE